MSKRSNGWIGVDLDGTLAYYTKWQGIEVIGDPVPLMLERVKKWLAEGREVRIFTARAMQPEAVPYIHRWCLKYVGQALKVTNVKDYAMIELWDDRAQGVVFNEGTIKRSDTEYPTQSLHD